MRTRRFPLVLAVLALALFSVVPLIAGGIQDAQEDTVTIRFTSHLLDTGQAGNAYLAAVERFEELNPDIDVEVDFIPTANYVTGIKTRILGGEQLDVVDYFNVALIYDVVTLSDDVAYDLSGSDIVDLYGANFLDPVTIDGSVVAVPETMNSNGLIYNRTLFDELGLEPASTWDEFLELGESLKEAGYIPLAMAGEAWVPQFLWAPMIMDNGGSDQYARDIEAGEVLVTDPNGPYAVVMRKLLELQSRGFFPEDWLGLKQDQSKDLLAFNRAGMLVTGTWDLASLMDRNPDNEYGVMVIPGNDSGQPTPVFNIGVWRTVAGRTEHPEAALRFVEFMNGPDNLVELSRNSKSVPVMEGIDVGDPVVELVEAIVRSPTTDMFWKHYLASNAVNQLFNTYSIRILAGESFDATLEELQSEIDKAMAQ